MRIYFNRYRFKSGIKDLLIKAGRSSRGFGRYVKGTYMDRMIWSLKVWSTEILSDKREERKEKRK